MAPALGGRTGEMREVFRPKKMGRGPRNTFSIISFLIAGMSSPGNERDLPRSVVAWRWSRLMSTRLSTKTQNEENRAVMGLELLGAVCGLKG